MSDLFHEDVPDAFIDQVFAVMAIGSWHTFIVLTKRPERMRAYLSTGTFGQSIIGEPSAFERVVAAMDQPRWLPAGKRFLRVPENWPLPNVQLGVSVENQETADERIQLLLQTPAAKRIVSYEPALGPVKWSAICWETEGSGGPAYVDVLGGTFCTLGGFGMKGPKLDGVIVGGESGPKARPCDVAWIRSTLQQCRQSSVACFVKQLGAHVIDRNDRLGTDTEPDDPRAWPEPESGWDFGSRGNVQEDLDGTRDGYQGAPVRIHTKNKKGADIAEWPADLRVREVV
jgi:protein gp37